jgi:lysophospholipase L1-like esterase
MKRHLVFLHLLLFVSGCGFYSVLPIDPNAVSTVFIGDSMTQFWNLNLYFPSAPYVNCGIAGQTTDQILYRFDSDVVARHPRMVIILAGTNDVLRFVPLETSIANVRSMVAKARAAHIEIVLGTLPPVASDLGSIGSGYDFNPDVLAYNSALSQLSEPLADYHTALTGQNGLPLPGSLVDGVHPTQAGYAKMAKVLRSTVP